MGEESYFWDGHTIGDATKAPYSMVRLSHFFAVLLNGDRTLQGPVGGYNNELAVTGATSPLSMNTGAAMVAGLLYENTAALSITVPTPVSASRIDVIALEVDVSAQTIRAKRVAGVEGGGVPAMTQTAAIWQIPLYQATITTAGAITLTDVRNFVRTKLAPGYEHASLAAGDGAHTASAWNDIGGASVLQLTLTAGTWLIMGHLTAEAGVTPENRGVRIYNNTSGAILASSYGYAPAGYKVSLSLQVVVTITAKNVVKLQYYAVDAADIVHAVVGSGTTKITALRVA